MRGYVVVYDRHFLFDAAPGPIHSQAQKQERLDRFYYWILSHWYPKPDLAIFLDAPGEVLYERKGEYATALRWLDQGLSTTEGETTLEAARIHLAKAGVHSRQGQHHQALESCQRGPEIARQLNASAELAHGTYLLSAIYSSLGRSADELACARESLALYEQTGDLPGQANALNEIGIALMESGDWPAATDCYQRALKLNTRTGHAHEAAKVTNNLGNVLFQRGLLDEAEQAYHHCLQLWAASDFPLGVALSLSNLGEVDLEQGQRESALDRLQRSESLFLQIQSQQFLPEVYRRQALVHLGLSQFDEARVKAERSVALAGELDMEGEKALTLRVLGQVLLALGQRGPAEEALAAAMAGLEAQGNRFGVGQTLAQLARLYGVQAQDGDTAAGERSRVALERARAIFAELGAQRELGRVQDGVS